MCHQQSLRSACAYSKSDQSLCSLLEYSMTVRLLTEHYLEFLSLKGSDHVHFDFSNRWFVIYMTISDHVFSEEKICKFSVNILNFRTQYFFSSLNKMVVKRAGVNKMFVRIATGKTLIRLLLKKRSVQSLCSTQLFP